MTISVTDDALSTNDAKNLEVWKDLGGFYGNIVVPTITLENISNQFGGFSFINIDVEGQSVDIFKRMLALQTYPLCVCFEHDGRMEEAMSAATAVGYKLVYSNGTNCVVTR